MALFRSLNWSRSGSSTRLRFGTTSVDSVTRKASLWLAGATLFAASSAHAAGIDETTAGGIGLGRAAATASVDDFMAVLQNPANLAVANRGLGSELRVPIFNACYDRAYDPNALYRQPDPDTNFKGTEYYGSVCNRGAIIPTGNAGFARSYPNGVGYGFGLYAPSAYGAGRWGNTTIVTVNPGNETLPTTTSGLESPNRQMLLSQRSFLAYLMAGVGYQPIPQLRFGASVGAGLFAAQHKNVGSQAGGSFRDAEVITNLNVHDWFVPRAMASAVVSPTKSFDLFSVLSWQGDINATGHADFTANGISGAPLTNCRSMTPGTHCRLDGVKSTIPMVALEATAGFRYAALRHARGRTLNPMKDELWDISVEGAWSQTSHIKEYKATLYNPMATPRPGFALSSDPTASLLPPPPVAIVPRHWKDTYSVRAGGDWNVIKEVLSLRLGLSYSSNAVPPAYMNVDVFPVQKIGLHGGFSFYHANQKITLAYAHLFYKDVTVPVGTGQVKEIVVQSQGQANAVNEGHYKAMADILTLQTNIFF